MVLNIALFGSGKGTSIRFALNYIEEDLLQSVNVTHVVCLENENLMIWRMSIQPQIGLN